MIIWVRRVGELACHPTSWGFSAEGGLASGENSPRIHIILSTVLILTNKIEVLTCSQMTS